MKHRIDIVRIRENNITINGWAIGKKPESQVKYTVLDGKKQPLDFKLVSIRRDDVSAIYFGKVLDKEYGFDIKFPYERGNDYYLRIEADGRKRLIKFNKALMTKRNSEAYKKMQKLLDLCNMETVEVAFEYFKKHGIRKLIKKSKNKLEGIDFDLEYAKWYEETKPKKEELEEQRNTSFDYMPKLSIVIPAYATPENYLRELIESLLAQTYSNFEICIADGSPKEKSIENVLKEYAAKDNRVRYKILGENLGIAGNTNEALSMATGDYIALCDHDDILPENALFECVSAINKNPDCDCIYTDEDKLDMDGGSLFEPNFKPDFNIDMLCSVNYICHLFVAKRELVETCGNFNAEYDGAQDYDFIFRITEKAKHIVHVPKVLYHWRCHMNSTASNPKSKLYAFQAGAKAIRAHYSRVWPDIKIDDIQKGIDYGIYHTYFHLDKEPLVSVIIPNKDHADDLDTAIRSLMAGSYKNLEFIVIENNSTEDKTWKYYEKIQAELSNVKVVKWDGIFNYSAINNFGIKYANGEYLLLMNNDIEVINPDTLRELLGYGQREEVGAVGCKLLYEDDTIQHAGVVVGFGGVAGHTFVGLHDCQNGYCHRAVTAQDYSAVTAACMLVRKSVFDAVGGLSEEFAVAFNDIDFCLKIRKLGKLIVYNPYATCHHYESKSRGLEDTPEKVDRFNREAATFIKKWSDILNDGDPYYNPNLTLRRSNFALRDLTKEKIGEPCHLHGIEKYM